MSGALHEQSVLVIGRRSGIARAVALSARNEGARVVVAGRDRDSLTAAYADEPGISTETVDLTDETSIAALGERLGTIGHVVSTASARARGRITDLERDAIRLSFDTKVIGPPARHGRRPRHRRYKTPRGPLRVRIRTPLVRAAGGHQPDRAVTRQ